MWSGFSSEIETPQAPRLSGTNWPSRMWSGFSSEIETHHLHIIPHDVVVACGAASRLRLKRLSIFSCGPAGEVACGAASRLRLKQLVQPEEGIRYFGSHVERLLV